MATVNIDFTQASGPMKEVHGVGQPPILGWSGTQLFHYLTEAGIPYSRLHDTGGAFGGGRFVDIPYVFPDFNADPEDPASYDFTFTDPVITGLMEADVEPYYRLGVTIENEYFRKAYHIHPPADFQKWAKICAGIIRHYTKGWANGFEYKIRYWEIWNEADLAKDPTKNAMWTGTYEQYIDLYITTAEYLKREFPEIRIGGPACCGFYAAMMPKDAVDENNQWRLECADAFLKAVSEKNAPLDFFSWHCYGTAETVGFFAHYAAERLKYYGLGDVEQHLNEWNPRGNPKGSAGHAAETAATLITMQNSELAKAMFYDARCGTSFYGSLFNPMTFEPLKSYWPFVAFNELFKLGTQVNAETDTEKLYVLAAKDVKNSEAAAVIVNLTGTEQELVFRTEKKITSCRIVDQTHDFCPVNLPERIKDGTILLLTFG